MTIIFCKNKKILFQHKGSFRRPQSAAFSTDVFSKIEKILISKKTSAENAADCGRLNKPYFAVEERRSKLLSLN